MCCYIQYVYVMYIYLSIWIRSDATQGEVRHFQKGKVVMMTEGLPLLVHSKRFGRPGHD